MAILHCEFPLQPPFFQYIPNLEAIALRLPVRRVAPYIRRRVRLPRPAQQRSCSSVHAFCFTSYPAHRGTKGGNRCAQPTGLERQIHSIIKYLVTIARQSLVTSALARKAGGYVIGHERHLCRNSRPRGGGSRHLTHDTIFLVIPRTCRRSSIGRADAL